GPRQTQRQHRADAGALYAEQPVHHDASKTRGDADAEGAEPEGRRAHRPGVSQNAGPAADAARARAGVGILVDAAGGAATGGMGAFLSDAVCVRGFSVCELIGKPHHERSDWWG